MNKSAAGEEPVFLAPEVRSEVAGKSASAQETQPIHFLRSLALHCRKCDTAQTWMLPVMMRPQGVARLRCYRCGRSNLGASVNEVTR